MKSVSRSRKWGFRRWGLTAASLLLSVGCQTSPAPDSGYLEGPSRMTEQRERFPFDRVWVNPEVDRASYDKLVIGRVNTSYLLENTGWEAANPGNRNLRSSARDLAAFTRRTVDAAFRSGSSPNLRAVTRSGPGAMKIDLAIVELVPSKAVLGAAGLVAPALSAPGAAVGSKVVGGRPSVAIEGRVTDSQTGEILMMFADREESAFRPIDLKAATWWSHARDIIEDWSGQLVELANTPPNHTVKDSANFRLRPW